MQEKRRKKAIKAVVQMGFEETLPSSSCGPIVIENDQAGICLLLSYLHVSNSIFFADLHFDLEVVVSKEQGWISTSVLYSSPLALGLQHWQQENTESGWKFWNSSYNY